MESNLDKRVARKPQINYKDMNRVGIKELASNDSNRNMNHGANGLNSNRMYDQEFTNGMASRMTQ